MADAAAARREARRRRILENSHNRLQRISGKNVDTIINESQCTLTHSDDDNEVSLPLPSELERFNIPPLLNNGAPALNLESMGFLSETQDVTAAGDGETSTQNQFAPFATPESKSEVRPKSLMNKLMDSKYDIVLLSIVIQVVCSYSFFSPEETYFFLPLVMYEVTKWIWFPSPMDSKLVNMVLMLQGISSVQSQKILKIWQWVQIFIQDGCVYLFTTICIQALLISFKLLTI